MKGEKERAAMVSSERFCFRPSHSLPEPMRGKRERVRIPLLISVTLFRRP